MTACQPAQLNPKEIGLFLDVDGTLLDIAPRPEAVVVTNGLRDDLAAARMRYQDAGFAARAAGLSWTEIGRLLGVSRQQVHRQFRARAAD